MARFYTAPFKTSVMTGAKSLMLFQNPADTVIRIISADVVAPDNDTNEQMDLAFQKITTLGTPTATSVTPTKHSNGDAASGVTVSADVTASEPTYTANTEFGKMGASTLGGYHWRPAEDERPEISPGENFGLRLLTALGSPRALSINVVYEELGG